MRRFLMLFVMMIWGGGAHALCVAPNITPNTQTVTYVNAGLGYDPYSTANPAFVGSFTVQDLLGADCQYYVTLSSGAGSESARHAVLSGNTLRYNMYTDSGRTINWLSSGSHNASGVISGTVDLDLLPTRTHNFWWDVVPLQPRASTDTPYSDTLTATLRARGVLGWSTIKSVTITVNIPVKSSVDVSVGSTDAFNIGNTTHNVDLGDLANGVTKDFRTVVRSNSGHIVRFSSTNSQKLKHLTLPNTIDYNLTFDGAAVNLTGGGSVVVKNVGGVTPVAGQAYRSDVTVKNMNGLEPMGDYRDVINVTVSAQ